jgi:amino acid adenylation domain-containing protein/thioester reductase-like protein
MLEMCEQGHVSQISRSSSLDGVLLGNTIGSTTVSPWLQLHSSAAIYMSSGDPLRHHVGRNTYPASLPLTRHKMNSKVYESSAACGSMSWTQKETLVRDAKPCHSAIEVTKGETAIEVTKAETAIEPFTLLGEASIPKKALDEVHAHLLDAAEIVDAYPCTALQEGLMALSMKHEGKFVPQIICELPTDINLKRFREAWQIVVDWNGPLRTRLLQTHALGCLQVVVEKQPIKWRMANNLSEYLSKDRQERFELGQILFRYAIVQDAISGCQHFVWTVHHAVIDGWSMRLLLTQVDQAYRNEDVTELVEFKHFVAYLVRHDQEKAKSFWRQQLADLAALRYPASLPAPYLPLANSLISRHIKVNEQMKSVATTSTIIQAAWGLLIARNTHTSDVVFGLVLAGRNMPIAHIELINGPTFTTVPMRVFIDPRSTVREYMETIRKQKSAMKPHQHVGLQTIRKLGTDGCKACDFQNLLVIQPRRESAPDSLFSARENVSDHTAKLNAYPLMLQCDLTTDGFTVTASFDSAVVSEEQMQQTLHQLERIVLQMCTNTSRHVGDVEIEKHSETTLKESKIKDNKEVHACVHTLIEQRSIHYPAAKAIQSWDGDLTYGQLEVLSSRLAWRLKESGVGPEIMVALLFEKTFWIVVVMMAVMKAGGVFVPLDPAHPPARIESLIREIGGKLLLCSKRYESFTGIAAETIKIDHSMLELISCPESPPSDDVAPDNAVYIIFTSGSTGKPKGCVLEHRACSSTMVRHADVFDLNVTSRVFQFSSYAFDAAILEILTTLYAGGCVCIPSDAERLNELTTTMNKMNVNFAFMTPTVSRLISPESVPGLRTLLLGGEKVGQGDLNRWAGKVRLLNVYGPSECCVICVINEITSKEDQASKIGSGIIGTFLVVESGNQLAPKGTVGELFIGGPNLARGYFNDQRKTEAAFLDDPAFLLHSGVDCKRFYKTGDLVRLDVDGKFDYVGRKDSQVKLRGQRIEMGEIEQHLWRILDGVVDLAVQVIVPADDLQNPALVAFIVSNDCAHSPEDSRGISLIAQGSCWYEKIADVCNQMRTSLPQYMTPSMYVPLKTMPVTTSGKIDRYRLQSMVEGLTIAELVACSGASMQKAAPSTKQERKMQMLWAKVLNLRPDMISADDAFVRLGGDSILAMKLAAAARDEGILLTVADVFQYPRLSQLASVANSLECTQNTERDRLAAFTLIGGVATTQLFYQDVISQCAVSPDMIEDMYPCTPFQEGLMVLSLKLPGAYVARHVFELSDSLRLNVEGLRLAWETVVQSTPILRTRIILTESAGLMQVVVKEKINWTMDSDLNRYVDRDREDHMGYGTPLARYAIVNSTVEGTNRCYLVWTTHHAIYDGWSLPIILASVGEIYEELSTLEATDVDVLRGSRRFLPFNLFVASLQGLDRMAAETFWRAQLCEGEPSTFPSSKSTTLSRPSVSFQHKVKFVRRPVSDFSTSTVIRLAWAILLGKYANAKDVVFGVTMSGRTRAVANIESIIGPTINTVPIRILLEPSKLVIDLLNNIQTQMLDMIPFEHMGLPEIGRINPRAKAACEFQSLLIVQPKNESSLDTSILGPRKQDFINESTFDTYPLTMECRLADEGMEATAIYDPQVISEIQIQRMIFQFQHIMQALCLEQSHIKLQEIETISPEDIQQLSEWNPKIPSVDLSCVHDLIEQTMHDQPDSPAVCSWDGDLTYRSLSDMSSRLAHLLVGRGVRAESKVPIVFDKSTWAVVAILGIIKAGGAFVPLDPSHPVLRLQAICSQVQATVVLCSVVHAGMCSNLLPVGHVIAIGEPELSLLPEDSSNLSVDVFPHNALYTIFTSGTTGTPKGVVIEHGAYCSSARAHIKALAFDRRVRHLQFASYAFDTGVEDILSTLIAGGCLCIPSERERKEDIVGAIARMNVTSADLTPSYVSIIAPEDVPSLKALILGGESLTSKIVQVWADKVRLMNAYGTTECSVTNVVNSEVTADTEPANIGFAVGGACWIVDLGDSDQLAPIGTIGELLIEGPTLARGYLNDEFRTQKAFINDPAWACNAQGWGKPRRFYKTGDLVRYNDDGSIKYLGRKDTQVKLRGQRLELHEIESHLALHPQVKCGVAMLPGSGPYQDNLTAVIQLSSLLRPAKPDSFEVISRSELDDTSFDWSDMSKFLSDRLPAYMIPTTWIVTEGMPFDTSGKLDRSRVRAALESLPFTESKFNSYKVTEPSLIPAYDVVALEISSKIASLVAADLKGHGTDIEGLNVELSSIGMDSIRIASLAGFIKRTYGVAVGIQQLFGSGIRVRDVGEQVRCLKAGLCHEIHPRLDLLAEFSALDGCLASIQSMRPQLGIVFLTGATGFLGTQILRQLLSRPNIVKVITHVRATSPKHGRQRIIDSAKAAKWWSQPLSSKLEVWVGDLALTKLGLDRKQWASLKSVNAIIHNGATVKWNADFHALKPANVNSTFDLLTSIAKASPQPKFVYISGGRDFAAEMDDKSIADELAPLDGYSQTKFVSEMLVNQFMQRSSKGDRVAILKPDLIIGTAQEGIANVDDFLWRYVAASVSINAYPEPDQDDWLWVSSASYIAARAIEVLHDDAERPAIPRNGVRMQEFWDTVNMPLQGKLQPVSDRKWLRAIREDVDSRKEAHPLWPVMHLLREEGNFRSRKGQVKGDVETDEELRAAVKKNVEYLLNIGFLGEHGEGHVAASEEQGSTRSF